MDNKPPARKKKKYICPNPLFEKWLMEWKEAAASKGFQSASTYARALKSLRKYPLPLKTGKEAKILEFFGDKICAMLDEKLMQWRQDHGLDEQPHSSQSNVVAGISKAASILNGPNRRVHPITIKPSVTIKRVKKVCSPKQVIPETNEIIVDENSQSEDRFFLLPGSYSILLCVDNAETLSSKSKTQKSFLADLQKSGIKYDARKLHVGDFLWVARENGGQNRELVLNFVVERKRLDDLAKSIKDGRFREQKFRLKNCGLKQPIYLIEYHSSFKYSGIPEATLEQAIVNIQIVDHFLVKQTKDIKESVSYLTTMTRMLTDKYQGQVLQSGSHEVINAGHCSPNTLMAFKEFNCSSIKNKSLTVKEMFAKHLLQFFGLSVDRASAIVDQFQTLCRLYEAYEKCMTEAEKMELVANLRFGKLQKCIGKAVSKSLYQVYCIEGPLM